MTKYSGGCHCGKVRYEVDMELQGLISCNCSICSKKGLILGFVGEKQFSLKSGKEILKDYQFNKHHIHHLFCTNCGVSSFANGAGPDGSLMYAINVRCLDDVDVTTLQTKPVDGKSL
ncbi:GFA family protein [Oligoflexus tunisiensis]|uniref:GFA family protein n=1 Tax=Oligoflexus tunisiensis TaxID=708132 RepID=UPI00114CAE1D|nr:GFA family protein [Oligoflexus tunisiensis]